MITYIHVWFCYAVLACLVGPAGTILFKINNGKTRAMYEIGSKSKIKTPEWHQWRYSRVYLYCLATLLKSHFGMLHIFRTPFTKNTSGRLLLYLIKMIFLIGISWTLFHRASFSEVSWGRHKRKNYKEESI